MTTEIELTEEEMLENIKKERRDKYKATHIYLQSEEYESLIEHFKTKGANLVPKIRKEIAERKKVVAVNGEVDVVYAYVQFLNEVLARLGESEGEKIYKSIIQEQIDNGWTNIENKVEELGDVPIYSALDFMKQERIDMILLNKRMENWSNAFLDKKDEKMDLDPYED